MAIHKQDVLMNNTYRVSCRSIKLCKNGDRRYFSSCQMIASCPTRLAPRTPSPPVTMLDKNVF